MTTPKQVASRIRGWESGQPQGPVTLELYPTLACNLSCQFCDTTDRHRPAVDELSRARLLGIVDEAAAMGVQRVFILGGGEPLLRKDTTPALMQRVKELGMEGVLTTNGTLLDAKLTDHMIAMGWDEIHFSIDAPTPEIHDALRGQTGAFRRTIQAACRLAVRKRIRARDVPRIALHFVLTRKNHRTLRQMVELAHAVGAERIDFDALIAYTPDQLALRLTDVQRAEVPHLAAAAAERARELNIATTLEHLMHPDRLDRGNTQIPRPEGSGLKGAPCLKAWHYMVVQADGRVSPCCVLAGLGSSVADTTLNHAWTADSFIERVRSGMLSGEPLPRCRECSWNILQHEATIRSHL